jgi:peptidoglycan/LPS O-acetylase OafA/YrhL
LLKYFTGGGWDLGRSIGEWIQNLTLTQWLSLINHPQNAAAENPKLFVAAFWSLCYEEQFYLVVALLLATSRRFPNALLIGSIVLTAGSLAQSALYPTLKFGFFIEYWATFATGLFVFYRQCVLKSRSARLGIDVGLISLFALSAAMTWIPELQTPITTSRSVNSWPSLNLASGVALLLVCMRSLDSVYARSPIAPPLRGLARISYSLYLIHQFCLAFSDGVAKRVAQLLHMSAFGPLVWSLQVLVVLGVAAAFWAVCERPFLNAQRH